MPQTTRIGLIGYGQIGAEVHQMIGKDPNNGMEVVFVHDQMKERLQSLQSDLVLNDLGDFASKEPDLVVEMAHPDVTRQWGEKLLQNTNYLLISVTALADPEIEKMLEETTQQHGTRAFLPHGGVVGMDALLENRNVWDEVHSVMKKPPKNVDCAAAGVDPDSITKETVLYDGPTRHVCPKFPRNTNTLAAIAYAGIGFDRTRSTLIVNPDWDTATVEIHAKVGGITLDVSRVEGITGVTGASTPASIFNTIQMIGSTGSGIHIR